jgi:hypothetical protein
LSYRYTVDDTVLELFASASRRDRVNLLKIFEFLAREPFTEGEATQADRAGRRCQIKQFGGWRVIFWAEHIVREIHILDVERIA